MNLKFRVTVNQKAIKRYIGIIILVVPFFLLLLTFDEKGIREVISRPYWKRALAERAKRVPHIKEEKETVEDIKAGTRSELPLYHLYIKPNTLAELEELLPRQKEHEPGLGILPQSARIYKPANFEYKGKNWPVRIRFRGDNPIHWRTRKQSWRVKFSKDDIFNGARRIDLINPKSADMLTDYLAMWLAERMGLLAPKITFVNLKLNHRHMGVYQETEHIDKYFLENHGRPVGNIYGEKDKKPNWFGVYSIYTDVAFWRKHCKSETQSPDDYSEIERFIRILNHPSDNVFNEEIFNIMDKDKFYLWNCHALLSSSGHQDWTHNARLYFDPTRCLFEFIPWDLSGFWLARWFFFDVPHEVHGSLQDNPLSKRVLQHGPFRYERDRLLWSYVKDPSFLDELLGGAKRMRDRIKTAVYNDPLKETIGQWPNRASFTNREFEESFKNLKRVTRITFNRICDSLQFNDLKADIELFPPKKRGGTSKATVLAKIGLVNSASSAAVIKGIQLPVKGEGLSATESAPLLELVEDTNSNHRFDHSDRVLSSFNWNRKENTFTCDGFQAFIYPDIDDDLQPISTRRDFFIVRAGGTGTPQFDTGMVELHAENAVTEALIEVPFQEVDENLHGLDIPLPATIGEFRDLYPELPCSIIDGKRIVLESGEHRISSTLVIPEAAILEIPEETTLKFAPGCSLMCYGRIEAKGTYGKLVRFTAENPEAGWGVVALCRSGASGSVFEHCVFEYGGEAQIHGGYFSGALSAYHATVEVSDCLFRSNRGDDAINCKYADGTVSRCVFTENAADAIDFDYCEGIIADSNIVSSGNDGIDCGTASPLIMGNLISDCGDKGISVGEKSRSLIINNVIRDCEIGIASKDMSDPLIANDVLWNNETGISLYRKKFMFPGGGRATIVNTIIWGGGTPIEKDDISECTVEHSSVEGGTRGNGNVKIRPGFVDPGGGNYLLKENSPLAEAGMDPGVRPGEILGIPGDTFPIGLAKPLNVPEKPAISPIKKGE